MNLLESRAISALAHPHSYCEVEIPGSDIALRTTEAIKLGHGGIVYISRVLGCDYRTIKSGIVELQDEECLQTSSIRRSRGGRKSAFEVIEGLDGTFLKVIEQHTAGSPVDETVRWTNLSRPKVADLLKAEADRSENGVS